jgi:hypothetical protein
MTQPAPKEKPHDRSPGGLTHLAVYIVAASALYFGSTPEVTGNFTERQENDFHIAAVRIGKGALDADYSVVTLAQIKAQKVDVAAFTFLLPQDVVDLHPGGDLHKATVLERHPDWQLVKYDYGNTHDSVSKYRAFKDRIEPVSYRQTMDMGMMFSAILLLIPVSLVSALINAIWRLVARRRGGANPA